MSESLASTDRLDKIAANSIAKSMDQNTLFAIALRSSVQRSDTGSCDVQPFKQISKVQKVEKESEWFPSSYSCVSFGSGGMVHHQLEQENSLVIAT